MKYILILFFLASCGKTKLDTPVQTPLSSPIEVKDSLQVCNSNCETVSASCVQNTINRGYFDFMPSLREKMREQDLKNCADNKLFCEKQCKDSN
jgi:hypothetical protein